MKLTDLISSELDYFRPMIERDKQSSFEQRELWRGETIRQRQKRISLELFNMLNGTVKYGPFKDFFYDIPNLVAREGNYKNDKLDGLIKFYAKNSSSLLSFFPT